MSEADERAARAILDHEWDSTGRLFWIYEKDGVTVVKPAKVHREEYTWTENATVVIQKEPEIYGRVNE